MQFVNIYALYNKPHGHCKPQQPEYSQQLWAYLLYVLTGRSTATVNLGRHRTNPTTKMRNRLTRKTPLVQRVKAFEYVINLTPFSVTSQQ